MIFSKKNAGKWVASRRGKVVATSDKLEALVKEMEGKKEIRFDKVPSGFFVG